MPHPHAAARSTFPASAGREPIMWAGLSLSPRGLLSRVRRRVTRSNPLDDSVTSSRNVDTTCANVRVVTGLSFGSGMPFLRVLTTRAGVRVVGLLTRVVSLFMTASGTQCKLASMSLVVSTVKSSIGSVTRAHEGSVDVESRVVGRLSFPANVDPSSARPTDISHGYNSYSLHGKHY